MNLLFTFDQYPNWRELRYWRHHIEVSLKLDSLVDGVDLFLSTLAGWPCVWFLPYFSILTKSDLSGPILSGRDPTV